MDGGPAYIIGNSNNPSRVAVLGVEMRNVADV